MIVTFIKSHWPSSFVVVLCCLMSISTEAGELETLIATVAKVGPQGAGSAEARAASSELAERGVSILPNLLRAMDTDNVVAANWYRTAYEAIVAREAAKETPEFPIPFLQEYVRDSKRQGRPRRIVLRLLDDLTPSYRDSVMPRLVEDHEFRSDAVALVLKQGDQAKAGGNDEAAKSKYEVAFNHARDVGQVTAAADRLKAVGVDVNIVEHMGFVTSWLLLGPFDAPARSGFDESFPPEKAVDLDASYAGKDAKEISWKPFKTEDRLGQINLAQAIAPVKEAVGYAYTELSCSSEQAVQLRCGADDNLTVWLNGEKILARRQWLNGTRLDRFTAPATLMKGTNKVLVKICQGPQHKNPAVPNNWSLQLRFCDTTGRAAEFELARPDKAN